MSGSFFSTALTERHYLNDRRDFPRMRREWTGRRVAVRYIRHRGSYHRHTDIRWAFGTLIQAERDGNIAVRLYDGTTKSVHYRRVTHVFDMTRSRV